MLAEILSSVRSFGLKKRGRFIREARKECGLSERQLAQKVEISTSELKRIEGGKTELSLLELAGLCWFLLTEGCRTPKNRTMKTFTKTDRNEEVVDAKNSDDMFKKLGV